jgi:acyl carrier protein
MDETEKRVIETMRLVFSNKRMEPPALTPDTKLDSTLGLESIDFAELVLRLEQEFKCDPFASGQTPAIENIRDLAKLYAS